jgi:hypothetical protein
MSYLPTYLPTYTPSISYILLIYLLTYLPTIYQPMSYLPTIYLLMKKIEVQKLLYTLIKHFMEIQGYMLNPFRIIVLINMYLSVVYIMKHQ